MDGASSNHKSFEVEGVAFIAAPLEPPGPTALPMSKPRNFRVMRAHDMLGLGLVRRLIARTLFIRFGAMLEISIP